MLVELKKKWGILCNWTFTSYSSIEDMEAGINKHIGSSSDLAAWSSLAIRPISIDGDDYDVIVEKFKSLICHKREMTNIVPLIVADLFLEAVVIENTDALKPFIGKRIPLTYSFSVQGDPYERYRNNGRHQG